MQKCPSLNKLENPESKKQLGLKLWTRQHLNFNVWTVFTLQKKISQDFFTPLEDFLSTDEKKWFDKIVSLARWKKRIILSFYLRFCFCSLISVPFSCLSPHLTCGRVFRDTFDLLSLNSFSVKQACFCASWRLVRKISADLNCYIRWIIKASLHTNFFLNTTPEKKKY